MNKKNALTISSLEEQKLSANSLSKLGLEEIHASEGCQISGGVSFMSKIEKAFSNLDDSLSNSMRDDPWGWLILFAGAVIVSNYFVKKHYQEKANYYQTSNNNAMDMNTKLAGILHATQLRIMENHETVPIETIEYAIHGVIPPHNGSEAKWFGSDFVNVSDPKKLELEILLRASEKRVAHIMEKSNSSIAVPNVGMRNGTGPIPMPANG